MEANQTIESIRNAENRYRSFCPEDINSNACINSFIAWHSAAALAFSHIKDVKAKPFFDKFVSIDRSVNGFGLKSSFNLINAEYEILMDMLSSNSK